MAGPRRSLPRPWWLTVLAVSGTAASALAAPLQVVSLTPARNTVAAPTTAITVEFDKAVDPATIGPATFRVFGTRSGARKGTLSLSNANHSLTFTTTRRFAAGEIVKINLSHAIQAADLTFLRSAGYAWQFRVATVPSQGLFQQIDVMSNRVGDVQTRIYGAAATDLNEDGYTDLATINEVSADIRVTLNRANGSGLFQPFLAAQPIGVESSPNEAADFDNDGHADLGIAATTSNGVWVMLGAGDGTFSSTQEIPLVPGAEPHGIAALDVDGDADIDLVCVEHGFSDLAMMINNGSGVFSAPITFDGGVDGEYGLAAGDMNDDGITDLVVGGNDGQQIRVLLGNGDGTFTPGPVQSSGGLTWVVTLDDVNGDGKLDVSAANSFTRNGAILLGNGAGGLGAPSTVPMPAHTPSTDLGDLDGDGDADWVLSCFGGGIWRIYRNDGAGHFSFVADITAPDSPSCSVLVDVDNDGDLDMALTDEIADVIVLMRNTGVGAGVERVPSRFTLATNVPNPVVAGTRFRFALPAAADVRIDVFDTNGRRVATIPAGRRSAGAQDVAFDGRGANGRRLPVGAYRYRVTAGADERTGMMVVLR
jgi:hypothetical protein